MQNRLGADEVKPWLVRAQVRLQQGDGEDFRIGEFVWGLSRRSYHESPRNGRIEVQDRSATVRGNC